MKTRSLFWPFVLIATGVVWLLINLEVVQAANLWALANLLPYLLMAMGVGLIVRARWPAAGVIVSFLVVAGMLLSVVFAPRLGWDNAPSWGWNIGWNGTITGSGKIVSETRTVSGFTAVSVEFPAEVVIRQGEAESVVIEADDNLLPQLGTRVSGGTLRILNTESSWGRRVNPTKLVRISITVKDLHEIDLPTAGSVRVEGLRTDSLDISVSGAGHVELVGLNANSLEVGLSGAGDVTVDGTAGDVNLHISGLGSFRGEGLAVQTARVGISGAGNATLWVKSQLSVNISGAGSVSYYGSPHLSKDISGLGSVNKLGDK